MYRLYRAVASWLIVAGLGVALSACAGAAPTGSAPARSTPASTAGQPFAQELEQWEKETYQAALKEGRVVVYGFWGPTLEQGVTDFMAKRYPGLTLETLTTTTAAEKIRTEHQTGQYIVDVYLGGQTTAYQLAQLGLTEPFQPLAEKDPAAKWLLPASSYTSYPQVIYAVQGKGVMINTQRVPPNREPKSWKDLLDPFWSGKKIALDHPGRGGGPGGSWARWSSEYPELGRSFLEGLAKQDVVLATGSATPFLNAVARGEYYALVPAYPSNLLVAPGAPLKFLWLEPATGGGTTNLVILIKNAPHANAAKLFINMFLLPEFQEMVAKELWLSPNRLGVAVPDPLVSLDGRKVFMDTEEEIKTTTDWSNKMGREIFGQ